MPDNTISPGGTARLPKWPGWLPLLAGPAIAAVASARRPAWLFMWAFAGTIFLGCKWLTWWENAPAFARTPGSWSFAYLFLWPGMDPEPFIEGPVSLPARTLKEWSFAAAKTVFGAVLLWGVARLAAHSQALLAGWIGMFGLIFLLHFGAFHIAALIWQSAGIRVEPLMRMPIAARSLSDFWSVRWNRGFTDLAHRHLFQAVRPRLGLAAAMLVTFLASGMVHELVISVPARGGYGLPTGYFLLQGIGILIERSRFGRNVGMRRGVTGRAFALAVVGVPAFWLFHPPFVRQVIIPFMEVIKAI